VYFWAGSGDAGPDESETDPMPPGPVDPSEVPAQIRKKHALGWKRHIADLIEDDPEMLDFLLKADMVDPMERWEDWDCLYERLNTYFDPIPPLEQIQQEFFDELSEQMRAIVAACARTREP
jgi:hypothetical protein